jgi:hypothetical protein
VKLGLSSTTRRAVRIDAPPSSGVATRIEEPEEAQADILAPASQIIVTDEPSPPPKKKTKTTKKK